MTMKFSLSWIACLIFCVDMGIKPVYSGECGTLSFEHKNVEECQTAILIYTPNNPYTERKWFKEGNPLVTLYNYDGTNDETKYIESNRDRSFILSMLKVGLAYTGSYVVRCGRDSFSERAYLTVTQKVEDCPKECGRLSARNINIEQGKPVVLTFTISPGRNVSWEKKDESNYKQLLTKRYNILSQNEDTIHSLTILLSEYSDRGDYRVNCGDSVSNSVYVNITYSKPSMPIFENVSSTDYCKPEGCLLAFLNEEVTVKCFVKGGSNPIELNILKNEETITDAIKSSKSISLVTHNYVEYKFTPSQLDVENGVTLKCTVKNPALTEVLSASTTLYIKVVPEKIGIDPIEAVEDKQAEIHCIETNMRPPIKANLIVDSQQEHNTTMIEEKKSGNLYTITTTTTKHFNRYDNQKKVLCCSNIVKDMCEKTKISVTFPPNDMNFKEISKQNQENGDTKVELKYSIAESNPKSSVQITGVKNIQRTLVEKNYEQTKDTYGWTFYAIWSFNFTRDDNKREITFKVVTEGFYDQTLHYVYKINVTYYPIVSISGQNIVYLGDDVILTCAGNSNPPSTLSWYNQTDLIEETHGAEEIVLRLNNVSTEHSQTYTCRANNGIGGIQSKNISLIVKDNSERPVTQAVQPASGTNISSVIGPIVGCLLLVIILAIIVGLIIRKKRRNAPLEKRNTPQIKIEARKQSLHPSGNEPVFNNMALPRQNGAVDEQPEYACVIPKHKRGEAGASNKPDKNAGKETKEDGDNLVYAELDLAEYPDLAANRPLVTMHEQTEYVSIDFSKTGAAMIANDGDKN